VDTISNNVVVQAFLCHSLVLSTLHGKVAFGLVALSTDCRVSSCMEAYCPLSGHRNANLELAVSASRVHHDATHGTMKFDMRIKSQHLACRANNTCELLVALLFCDEIYSYEFKLTSCFLRNAIEKLFKYLNSLDVD
jgi:hypothetical protein